MFLENINRKALLFYIELIISWLLITPFIDFTHYVRAICQSVIKVLVEGR